MAAMACNTMKSLNIGAMFRDPGQPAGVGRFALVARASATLAALAALCALAACGDPPAETPPPSAPDAGPADPDSGDPDSGDPDLGDPDSGDPDQQPEAQPEGQDAGPVEDVPPDADPEDEEPEIDDGCDTFELEVERMAVLPLTSVEIAARGGSGQRQWDWVQNRSGGILDSDSGFYLSGQVFDVADEINVTDVACERTLKVTISVFRPFTLTPAEAEVTPGTIVCFRVDGGSGDPRAEPSPFTWDMLQAGSGDQAEVDARGCYTAGVLPGEDVVRAVDQATGQRVRAEVRVVAQARPIVLSTSALVLPAGESFPMRLEGGSGHFRVGIVDPDGIGATVEEGSGPRERLVRAGARSGVVTLRVVDELLDGFIADAAVTVIARGDYLHNRYGQHSDDNKIIDAGDVNGDGHPDVLVGVRASGLNGQNAGAAFLYLGGQDTPQGPGLGVQPAQTFIGALRSAFMGRGLAAGDFDRDGCQDIAIGVFGAYTPAFSQGEVQIHAGCAQSSPEREPWYERLTDNLGEAPEAAPTRPLKRLAGRAGGDRFGFELATGDFDGDGNDDLAVAAPMAESPAFIDPQTGAPMVNIGQILVFLNRAERGLDDAPFLIIDGATLAQDLTPQASPNSEFGYAMTSADLNGDGCDDLLVGTPRADASHGFANLYVSTASANHPSGCVLDPRPALALAPSPQDRVRAGLLGWDTTVGDFNGDCVPDLVVSQSTGAVAGGSNTAAGSVNVFFGDPDWHPDRAARLERLDADLVLYGENSDNFGWDVSAGDIDGDGIDDLISGARVAEHEGTVADVGEVRLFRGLISPQGCLGDQGAEAHLSQARIMPNEVYRNGDFFGATLALVGDLDGDQRRDLLVHAPRGPARDITDTREHLGRLYWWPSASPDFSFAELRPLDAPVAENDELIGSSVDAAGDLNADGFLDFIVGAPDWDRDEPQQWGALMHQNAGAAFIHFGGPDGLRATPDLLLADHTNHNGSDFFGFGVSNAGDFNGDGIDDVAVGAPFEDLGGLCTPCRINNANVNDVGAVFVYFGGADFGARHLGPLSEIPRMGEPDAIVCGPSVVNARAARTIEGGFDLNGDGFGDLMMADWNWNGNRGRLYYALGVPSAGSIARVCVNHDVNLLGEGVVGSDFLGLSQAVGDLNDDGCDDMLSGAYNHDVPGRDNVGAVFAWLGWGGPGCPVSPVKITLLGELANDNLGYSLAMADVDGDGIKDLAVGSTGVGPTNLAAVMVYSGQRLRDALSGLRSDTTLDLNTSLLLGALLDPTGNVNQNFGVAMNSLGDIDQDGFEDLIVGAQLSRPGVDLPTGAAFVFLGSDDLDLLSQADVIIAGERNFPDGRFGAAVAGGEIGLDSPGLPGLFIGAPFSEQPGPERGEMGATWLGLIRLQP